MNRFMARTKAEPRKRFMRSDELETKDRFRLRYILNFGFGYSRSYCSMSRDRFLVELRTSEKELLDFCLRFLKGSPIPGRDVLHDGPKLFAMFRAAEQSGLVCLRQVKAELFVPEKGA